MKDLILNFSWDKLVSLPPTEFIAFVLVSLVAVAFLGGLFFGTLWAIAVIDDPRARWNRPRRVYTVVYAAAFGLLVLVLLTYKHI